MYPLGKTCGYSFAEGKLLEVNGIVLLVIKNDHEFEHKLYSWGVRRVRAGMQLGSRNCPGLQGTPAHPSASFYKELRKNSVAPDPKPVEVPFYGADAMTRVIDVSNEPYRTLFWLTGQTGIRRSEVCALRVCDVVLERNGDALEQGIVVVKQKVGGGIVGRPKSKRPRVFVLSPKLTERIRELCKGKAADALVFTNSKGGMLNPDNLVKRHLKPVLAKAGITEGGMHTFRRGNAPIMDQANVPMKIRQDRLGHIDPKTTLGYTHAVSEDERRVAAEFDSVLCPNASKTENEKAFDGSERYAIQ